MVGTHDERQPSRAARDDAVVHGFAGGHLVSGDHREAVGAYPLEYNRQRRYGEADMIRRTALAAGGRGLVGAPEDEDVREPDDFEVLRADCHQRPAERISPEPFLQGNGGRRGVQVQVAIDDRVVGGQGQLSAGGRGRAQHEQDDERGSQSMHRGSVESSACESHLR